MTRIITWEQNANLLEPPRSDETAPDDPTFMRQMAARVRLAERFTLAAARGGGDQTVMDLIDILLSPE